MIGHLVVLGATGDLSGRFLMPALAALHAAGHLGEGFRLTGASREELTTEGFREWITDWLDRQGGDLPAEARRAVVASAHYQRADVTDQEDVRALIDGDEPVALYLALPPSLFPRVVSALRSAGLPAGSRIVLEKPFGEDLDSARELNARLAELVPEQAVFRVDHFLAMTTVQNVLGSRLANRVLEPLWNSTHIAEVEIVWDESLALEGRAGYYDRVGALKDMVQNHLLQVLCLVAMEPPVTLGERDLRDRKVDVLRSVRLLTEYDVVHRTRRARYAAGRASHRAGADRRAGARRTARLRAAVAGCAAGRSRAVDPRRRGGGGLAGAHPGAHGVGAGPRPPGGVPGGLGRTGAPARVRARPGDQGGAAARGDGSGYDGRRRPVVRRGAARCAVTRDSVRRASS